MFSGGFPLSCNLRAYVRKFSFTRVNIMEPKYERPQVNVKVERGSTFTFTWNLPDIASIIFTRVKFT